MRLLYCEHLLTCQCHLLPYFSPYIALSIAHGGQAPDWCIKPGDFGICITGCNYLTAAQIEQVIMLFKRAGQRRQSLQQYNLWGQATMHSVQVILTIWPYIWLWNIASFKCMTMSSLYGWCYIQHDKYELAQTFARTHVHHQLFMATMTSEKIIKDIQMKKLWYPNGKLWSITLPIKLVNSKCIFTFCILKESPNIWCWLILIDPGATPKSILGNCFEASTWEVFCMPHKPSYLMHCDAHASTHW